MFVKTAAGFASKVTLEAFIDGGMGETIPG